MKDNEIIKDIKHCIKETCVNCAREDNEFNSSDSCRYDLLKIALDLINRQKAEIERLKTGLIAVTDELTSEIINAKSEAIKEFWDKMRGYIYEVITEYDWTGEMGGKSKVDKFIPYGDNLVKEMTEQ